jgi:hypothetical protein
MDEPKVMICGIYTTAMTRLLTDKGFLIAQPSLAMAERFNLDRVHDRNVVILDRSDKQGVKIDGEAESAEAVVQVMSEVLPDMIVRERALSNMLQGAESGKFNLQTGFLSFDLEFPSGSKVVLDNVRR